MQAQAAIGQGFDAQAAAAAVGGSGEGEVLAGVGDAAAFGVAAEQEAFADAAALVFRPHGVAVLVEAAAFGRFACIACFGGLERFAFEAERGLVGCGRGGALAEIEQQVAENVGVFHEGHFAALREMVVEQAGHPEADTAGAVGDGQVGLFGRSEGTHALIAAHKGLLQLRVDSVVGQARPVVYGDGEVVHEAAVAGVVEIDEAGYLNAVEQHVVFEQVGMDDAVRQVAVGVGGEKSDFVLQQRGIFAAQAGQQAAAFGLPPVGMARVGHALIEALPGNVHFGEHGAGVEALGGIGHGGITAVEEGGEAGGFAGERALEAPVAAGNGRGAGHAVAAEVLAQVHEKWQLFAGEHLEDGEHIAAAVGIEEVVAVGYALGNTLQRHEAP
mgnify:CR=1 FL=1